MDPKRLFAFYKPTQHTANPSTTFRLFTSQFGQITPKKHGQPQSTAPAIDLPEDHSDVDEIELMSEVISPKKLPLHQIDGENDFSFVKTDHTVI